MTKGAAPIKVLHSHNNNNNNNNPGQTRRQEQEPEARGGSRPWTAPSAKAAVGAPAETPNDQSAASLIAAATNNQPVSQTPKSYQSRAVL